MNIIRNFWTIFIVALMVVTFSSCDDDDDETRYISTAAQLIKLSDDVNDADDDDDADPYINVVLTADIDLAGVEWTPIGKNKIKFYSATFDGNGHTIKNLTITSPDQPYRGLIGHMSEGEIKNLTIENPQIEAGEYVGAVCAKMYYDSSISNCKVVGGSVKGTSFVGGVVGDISWSPMVDCYNEGTLVEGLLAEGYNIGGVVGSSTSSTVEGCYNTGVVSGAGSYTGGVVGYTYFSGVMGSYNEGEVTTSGQHVGGVVGSVSTYIVACYNTADVDGGDFVGGVVGSVGSQYTDLSSYVTACYNTGSVVGTGTDCMAAGVAGKADDSTTFEYCYYTNSDSSTGTYIYDSSDSSYSPLSGDDISGLTGMVDYTTLLTSKLTLLNIAIDNFDYESSGVSVGYEYYISNGELLLNEI